LVLPLGLLLVVFGSGLARGEEALESSAVGSPGSVSSRDDLLREFKKYFRKYKDSASRVEAVLALEAQTDPQVVRVLEPILGDKDPAVVTAGVRVLAGLTNPACQTAIIELLASSKKEPVRLGILRVLAFGALSHDGVAVRECLADRSWQVRRRALIALVALNQPEFIGDLVSLCKDKEVAVRCAALDGLAQMNADEVRAPAGQLLVDDAWQVRASAIAALGRVRHRDSIPLLIEVMKVEEGRLVDDAIAALEYLTARAFGPRVELWERFWNQYKDRYQIPSKEELAKLAQRRAELKAIYQPGPGEATTYHGIQSKSRKVLFVIDVSGSMESEVVEKDRFKDGGYPSYSRMDIVKTELARTIETLGKRTMFNILSFATEVKPWKKKLVKANVLAKSSAFDWITKLEPLGGASNNELAAVGLVGTANLAAGRTNTWGALRWALAMDTEARRDPYLLDVDTIFFLSDGRPTHGKIVDIEDILKGVAEANELRKVVLHTIAIGEFQKTFMQRLAQGNGGVFVDLGR
jgi:HEAT repeat protein